MRAHKSIDRIVVSGIISFVCFVLIALSFKKIRYLFPVPQDQDIIGFTQFFGYPILFDNILFFCLLLIPVISFAIASKFLNEK